ncbi:SIR2 family protein [Lactococcus lactis]|uniref:SIR2 family protein n=1 Tax=Lactococcus lactis TaxID=1358 RepID=UPI0024176F13|nr:SIR2 family protein [Lactococcus lactis]MDG4985489.1 SIR2 family protein [Lactococcus lactis]
MTFIENIKEKNQFPIIFIGSGITQRYFKNAPTWEQLIIKLWEMISDENDYVATYHRLENEGKDEFIINLEIAKILEDKIKSNFYDGNLEIEGLTPIEAHKKGINPFKKLVSNIFMSLEKKNGVEEEIKIFSEMLIKARFIITTNYDDFIEQCFNDKKVKIKINVGNAGLFTKSTEYGELYKIHGSVKQPESICITKEDYKNNESKLAIVNAKILSNLTESPIIFLGYSLTDENIKRLLYDYSQNMPYEIEEAASRIGIVKYTKGKVDISDSLANIPDLGINYTEIRTDNYRKIYEEISKIEQGYLPSEISKFEGAFRRIIDLKGPANDLDTVITSFVDITKLTDEEIRNKNIVVAFGDNKYIYKLPKYEDYIIEYFSTDSTMPLDIALLFLAQYNMTSPIPFKKYQDMLNRLDGIPKNIEREAQLLEKRVQKFPETILDVYIDKGEKTYAKIYKERLETCSTIQDILFLNIPEYNKLNYILANLRNFSEDDLLKFIKGNFKYLKNNNLSPIFKKIILSLSISIRK